MIKIWLSLAHMGGAEQRFVQSAFDSNWVAPLGPNVDGFELDLEDWLSKKSAQSETHVVALSAGTAAVHLALVMKSSVRVLHLLLLLILFGTKERHLSLSIAKRIHGIWIHRC